MEKASGEMDLDEWEYIPDDDDDHGFLDIQLSRKMAFDQKCVFDMNYFICPSPTPSRHIFDPPPNSTGPIPRRGSKKLVPIPIRLEPVSGKNPNHEFVKDLSKVPAVSGKNPDHEFVKDLSEVLAVSGKNPDHKFVKDISEVPVAKPEATVTGDQEMISQVFFKKMKENEFVDMKMDSPNSGNTGIKPQPELGSFQFEEKDEGFKGEAKEHNKPSSRVATEQGMVKKDYPDSKIKGDSNWKEGDTGGFCIWKWRLSGFGALCSVGVAAATICIFIFGSHQRNKHQLNQKLHFQIYADDKRIKEMVNHATRLNHAISAARSVPLSRANISFGGYCNGL